MPQSGLSLSQPHKQAVHLVKIVLNVIVNPQNHLNLLVANLMLFSDHRKCHSMAMWDDNDWQF
jgi:hypothetical protein